jgi:hypothetical protein
MTPERQKIIEAAIIDTIARLHAPLDFTKLNQSISLVGLHQMLLSIPRAEFVEALQNMIGIEISDGELYIPTAYFAPK